MDHRQRAHLRIFFVAAIVSLVASAATAQVTETILHAFTNSPDGDSPQAGLIQSSDGNFYGTTSAGGAFGFGTVFRMTPSGTVTVLHSFAGGTDGALPYAALLQATDGNFYGTTNVGGGATGCIYVAGPPAWANSCGTIFRMTPAGTVTVLHAFAAGTDGAFPTNGAALIQATDGNFYGTTDGSGVSGVGNGTIFRMTPDGTVTLLHSFDAAPDGVFPSGLIQATDGNFYGTTLYGGMGLGNVFRMTPEGTVTVLHAFTGGTDGNLPYAGVIQATDGNFYGTTHYGGVGAAGCVTSPGCGTVFRMTPSGTVTILHAFTGGTDGTTPDGPLIQATDGNFYGTTPGSTAFKMTPSGIVTTLHTFTGPPDGSSIFSAALFEATDGSLYGTTVDGGVVSAGGFGTVFRLDTHLCVDTLTLSYTAGTLNLGFTLQSSVPTTWSTWAVTSGGVANLWSVPIPAVSPAVSFNVPIPGVPPIGNVGILTALSTPALGIMCFDWRVVNTGP